MTQVRKKRPLSPRPLSPKQAATCCGPIDDLLNPELFKSLCDQTRAQLLGCLIKCGRACSVTEVAECTAVDFSVVSRHLQLLARAGILESSKSGRAVSYTVRYGHLCSTLRSLADAIEQCCPAEQLVRGSAVCNGGCCGKC